MAPSTNCLDYKNSVTLRTEPTKPPPSYYLDHPPKIGQTLRLTRMAANSDDKSVWFRIAPTSMQRLRRFLNALFLGIGVCLFALILTAPDLIYNFFHPTSMQSDHTGLFHFTFMLYAAAILIIAFFAAIRAWLTDLTIFICPNEKKYVLSRFLTAKKCQNAAKLNEAVFTFEENQGFFGTSHITVTTGMPKTRKKILSVTGNSGDIKAVYHWITAIQEFEEN